MGEPFDLPTPHPYDGQWFRYEWAVSGAQAADLARAGLVVFGPGPRHWTAYDLDGHTASYLLLGCVNGVWRLRLEWES
jgi:hypothetical protein